MTWLFGLPVVAAILRIAVAIVEAIVPLVRFVIESLVSLLKWTWDNLWWPGLKGALDGIPQVLVILQLAGVGYLFYLNASTQLAQRDRELVQCRVALTQAQKPRARSTQNVPLWDLFGWFRLP